MKNRGIVVTGASSGIGRAIAIAIARSAAESARQNPVDETANTAPSMEFLIHYHSNREGALETAQRVRKLGCDAQTIAADLAQPEDVTRLFEEAFNRLAHLDTWINNAGADVLTGESASWSFERKLQRLLDVDLCGTVRLSRLVGPKLAETARSRAVDSGGVFEAPSMTFVGWDQAPLGMEGDAGMMFGPVKAAVMAFANSLAQTLAPDVRVNTVAPGWIKTAWGASTQGYWDDRARYQSLMNRWGTPEDVAQAVVYLSRPESEFVTGQTLNVNGGFNRRFEN